jgi:uncharacterized protein DUF4333
MALRYLAPVLLLAALAGCGKTTIDQGRAESFVRSYFTPDARSADCPDGVEAKNGKTLVCTVVSTDGQRFRVTAHVVDSDGRLRISSTDVRPES